MSSRHCERLSTQRVAREMAINRIRDAALPAAQAVLDTLSRPSRVDIDREAHGIRVTYYAQVHNGYDHRDVWIHDADKASPEVLTALAATVAIWTAEIVREYTAIEAGQDAEHEAIVAGFAKVQP